MAGFISSKFQLGYGMYEVMVSYIGVRFFNIWVWCHRYIGLLFSPCSVQREQLAAMLLVSNNATIVKNLFHQYQIDHGLPLPMEMYGDLISACTRFYTIYFMLEIFHIMVFRHGMKPYLWVRRGVVCGEGCSVWGGV